MNLWDLKNGPQLVQRGATGVCYHCGHELYVRPVTGYSAGGNERFNDVEAWHSRTLDSHCAEVCPAFGRYWHEVITPPDLTDRPAVERWLDE